MEPENKSGVLAKTLPALMDLIDDLIVVVDKKGKLLAANKSAEEISGCSQKELVGKSILELPLLDDKAKKILMENVAKRLKGEIIKPYDIKIISKTGETRHLEIEGKFADWDGEAVDFIVLHNVTQRKELEERLRTELVDEHKSLFESASKLRSIFDTSPDSIAVTDLEGKVVDCNQATLDLYGFQSREEVIGRSGFEFFAPRDQAKAAHAFEKLLKEGSVKNVELVALAKSGKEFLGSFSGQIWKGQSGKTEGVVAAIRNINERKKAEEELKMAASIFDLATDSIFVHDLEGNIVNFNEAACKLGGYSKEEMAKMNIHNLDSPESATPIESRAKLLLESGSAVVEALHVCKDKTLLPVEIHARTIDIEGKKLILSVARDISERKKAEEQLANLAKFPSENPNPVMRIAKNGTVLYANAAAQSRLSERKPEIGAPAPPHLRQLVADVIGLGLGKEVEVKHGDRIFLFTLAPVTEATYVNVYGLDITERKQSEEALRIAEEKFRMIFEGATDGILAADTKTRRFAFANPRICEITGYSLEELLKLSVDDIHPEEDLPYVLDQVAKQIQERTALAKDIPVLRKDERVVYCDVNSKPLRIGGQEYLVGFFRDMTERKKAEKALQESETKFRMYVENSSVAVFVVNSEGKYEYVNETASILLGYSAKELLTMAIPQIVFKEEHLTLNNFATLKEKGKVLIEIRLKKKDGLGVYVSLNAVKLPNGKLIAFCENITERKKAEEHRKVLERKLNDYSKHLKYMVDLRTAQLKDANERLVKSERLAAIGELAGMVGHDLRNPLTGIKNAAYYLKKKGATIPEADAKAMFEIIEKGIDHSDKIINDLLDYAREIHLDLEMCSPRKVLAEALTIVDVPEKVEIMNNIPNELEIRIDQNKIERVFINLIKNAIDALPNGGIITVDCKQTNRNVEISFADTGVGVPKEILPKLFSPLFTTKAQGMGFGLAICKRIAEAHGGKIMVESVVDKGTTFTVTLPKEPKLEDGGEKTWINAQESWLSTTTKT